ncbi:GNAT family N-acetyltransferase [Streptomyces nodosus]|uniref:GNAT family N-acetyltransferase n=1 Tax=Streptomyces nodosus TaxID=40318 RepID=UPI00380D0DF0
MVNQQPSRRGVEASLAPFAIRPQQADDIEAVVAFSLRAWQPVFESMGRVLGPRLNPLVYPDWAAGQARAVEEVCRDEGLKVWVAEIEAQPVGFVAVAFHGDPRSAEIDMIAVDPDHQCRGVGSALLAFALDRISAAGVHLAHIATGGDPGHAAARHTYEKAGFTALPLVRYYKELHPVHTD